MTYRIQSVRFYVRETGPARFPSALGKKGQAGRKAVRVTSPLCHARLTIVDDDGREAFGCSADRLSVRWLDKRPNRSKALKLRELVSLIEHAGQLYESEEAFETPFDLWRSLHPRIMQQGRADGQEDLTSSFASALLERAVIDAVCRLRGKSFIDLLRAGDAGFDAGRIEPELKTQTVERILPRTLETRIGIRHTVGLFDPLTADDWPAQRRLNDGLPETLDECIRTYGLRYFKVKISGNAQQDMRRLERIWELLPHEREPEITLDANEAFEDPEAFVQFVRRLEDEQLGLFQHILYIEQPLPRRLALDPKSARWIRRAGRMKPLIIDESDGSLDAFRRAHQVGYSGTSHKNCKGVFKSLVNRARLLHYAPRDPSVVLSGEDLQNLPVVPLQQDYVTVAALGLAHCERNGHHYNFGLSMLSDRDKEAVTRRHRDLYVKRGNEWFLRIRDGAVETASLHGPGFGVQDEPDWDSMTPLKDWLRVRYPA